MSDQSSHEGDASKLSAALSLEEFRKGLDGILANRRESIVVISNSGAGKAESVPQDEDLTATLPTNLQKELGLLDSSPTKWFDAEIREMETEF